MVFLRLSFMPSLGSYPSSVNQNAKSSRTTIPKPIVKALSLSNKEKISWTLNVDSNGTVYVIVKKDVGPK